MSRWPWVSRESYDDMRRARDAERENAQVLRRDLSTAYEQAIQAMRLLTHPAVVVTPVVEPPEPKPLSPVAQVIREQSWNGGRRDYQLETHLSKLARELRAAGKTEDEIVGALCEWQTSEAIEVE